MAGHLERESARAHPVQLGFSLQQLMCAQDRQSVCASVCLPRLLAACPASSCRTHTHTPSKRLLSDQVIGPVHTQAAAAAADTSNTATRHHDPDEEADARGSSGCLSALLLLPDPVLHGTVPAAAWTDHSADTADKRQRTDDRERGPAAVPTAEWFGCS